MSNPDRPSHDPSPSPATDPEEVELDDDAEEDDAEDAAPGEETHAGAASPAAPSSAEAASPAAAAADPRPTGARGRGRSAAYGAIAVAIVLALGAGFAAGRVTAPSEGSSDRPDAAVSPAPGASAAASPRPELASEGNRLGSADAAVVIDYWADYQCPFCARFAEQVIPALESRIADGSVALVHRDYAFLGPDSIDAAVAVRCAAREDRYWEMHDAVYAAQEGENQGAFGRPLLAEVATQLGLDRAAFERCMDEREPLVEVLADTAAGVRTGIESTPSADVNGQRFLGVPDLEEFLAAVDAAIAGAPARPLPTAAPPGDPWSAIGVEGRTAGPASAPVTVELWMDYQAPDSIAVAQALGPELRTRVEAGALRVVQRDVAVLGEESVAASSLVACVAAQDGPAWFVHDILASAARGAGTGIFVPANLLRVGAQLGLDVQALDTCLRDPAVTAAIRAETTAGAADDVTAGPTVIVRRGDAETARFTGPLDATAVLAAIDSGR